MRRAYALLAVLLLGIAPRPAMAPDIASVVSRGTLRVAMLSTDQPPFFERASDGTLHGIDADLARGIASALGVRVIFDRSASSFDAAAADVATGKDDVAISKLSVSMSRARALLFTRPYVHMHRALLFNRVAYAKTAKDNTAWELIHHFRGTLGVIAHSSYEQEARATFPDATISPFATWKALVQSVRSGATDAAFRDELSIRSLSFSDPGDALAFQTIVLSDTVDDIAAAVRWNAPTLLAFVNSYIELHGMPYDANGVMNRLETR